MGVYFTTVEAFEDRMLSDDAPERQRELAKNRRRMPAHFEKAR
jgi:hypothetical protein